MLFLSARTVYFALAALLPVLPEKAAAGLAQLGVTTKGRSLQDLFGAGLPAGHKVGTGQPLFPKVIAK